MTEEDRQHSPASAPKKGRDGQDLNPETGQHASAFVPKLSSFAEVMQRALYDPAQGYYGRGPRRIGRGGDFFTAVSVGPLYGRLLAQVAAEVWEETGRPAEFTLVEQGAHDGQLALDVWRAWPYGDKPRYVIVEPQAAYRAAQQAKLVPVMGGAVTWVDSLEKLAGRGACPAFFFSNELLDAFPVHRVRWTGQSWEELMVSPELEWVAADLTSEAVREEVTRLPTDLPEGYTTEVHPLAARWMREVAAVPFRGAVLIADYGYEASEYYAPERSDGTLRRYREHRSDGKVLEDLGECDLTAHIDFSRVIEEAEGAGMRVARFMEQGRFLTHAATGWLKSLEGRSPTAETMAALRQFQTLTHPSHMGRSFRMLLLRR